MFWTKKLKKKLSWRLSWCQTYASANKATEAESMAAMSWLMSVHCQKQSSLAARGCVCLALDCIPPASRRESAKWYTLSRYFWNELKNQWAYRGIDVRTASVAPLLLFQEHWKKTHGHPWVVRPSTCLPHHPGKLPLVSSVKRQGCHLCLRQEETSCPVHPGMAGIACWRGSAQGSRICHEQMCFCAGGSCLGTWPVK